MDCYARCATVWRVTGELTTYNPAAARQRARWGMLIWIALAAGVPFLAVHLASSAALAVATLLLFAFACWRVWRYARILSVTSPGYSAEPTPIRVKAWIIDERPLYQRIRVPLSEMVGAGVVLWIAFWLTLQTPNDTNPLAAGMTAAAGGAFFRATWGLVVGLRGRRRA